MAQQGPVDRRTLQTRSSVVARSPQKFHPTSVARPSHRSLPHFPQQFWKEIPEALPLPMPAKRQLGGSLESPLSSRVSEFNHNSTLWNQWEFSKATNSRNILEPESLSHEILGRSVLPASHPTARRRLSPTLLVPTRVACSQGFLVC